jgi:quercetin dioxygenase-like cupin family protein
MIVRLVAVTLTAIFIAAGSLSQASSPPPAKFEELSKSSTGWDGQPFVYPPGEAELTMMRVTMNAGGAIPWHCHPVPVIAYVISGELEVTKPNGEKARYLAKHGEIEVFRQLHKGVAVQDTEIIVIYAGAKDLPNTVLQGDQSEGSDTCP